VKITKISKFTRCWSMEL